MENKKIVKNTMVISFLSQIIILFIGVSAQFLNLNKKDLVLKDALILENIVQFIEGSFYLWFIYYYLNNVDKVDIAKYRYYDWFFTTPTMILSTIVFFKYNNTKNDDKSFRLYDFIKTDIKNIIQLFSYNFGMLFIGYLQEIGVINIIYSTLLGFLFFGLLFYTMYIKYIQNYNSKSNYLIFYVMLSIWSIYGIAATFGFQLKNAFYNILDVFSKNFYSLFLAYLVYKLSG